MGKMGLRFILVGALTLAYVLPVYAQRVILFGVDGLASEGIERANTPNIHALMKSGSWSLQARAVIPTISSPNWAAMIMGAPTELTGVTSNDWQPDSYTIAPACADSPGHFPTLFNLEHIQHPNAKIGIFTDWPAFTRLVEAGAATKVYVSQEVADEAFDHALQYLRSAKPDLLFLHLDNVDDAGHEFGWESPKYLAQVEKVDGMLGRLLTTLDALNLRSTTVILFTADHGGIGTIHGGYTMNEIQIPWIISGPGIRKNNEIKGTIMQYDTAATLAAILHVKPSDCWRGRPVAAAFTESTRR